VPEKFDRNTKQNVQVMLQKNQNWKYLLPMEKILKFNKHRAEGPGKNTKLINVGPTFIPDFAICVNFYSNDCKT
jgi:hypothetical protein